MNPKLSAYAQVHGQFNFNVTPIGPPGTKVQVHIKPSEREAWHAHGMNAWYVGPSMNHYRNYKCYMLQTLDTRNSDTVDWLPSRVRLPTACSMDVAAAAARDLITALQNPSTKSPLHTLNTDTRVELAQLADIFSATSLPVQDDDIIIENPTPANTYKVPRVSFKYKLTDTNDNTTAIMAAHLRERTLVKENDTEIMKC